MFYQVTNGYMGDGYVFAIVEAEDPISAIKQASAAFLKRGNGPNTQPSYYEPGPQWTCGTISLPFVVD